MARPLRVEIRGGFYHVYSRGNERQPIFHDDLDRICLLETLAATLERHSWPLLCYCLMDNHYHFLLQTPNADLSSGMHYLNSVYAQRFNRRHGRVGHIFQGRFGSVLVQDGPHLLTEVRYIVRNRVRKGDCKSPRDWPWCSHNEMIGLARSSLVDVGRVLKLFHGDVERAVALYCDFVESAAYGDAPRGMPPPPIVGDRSYIDGVLRTIAAPAELLRCLDATRRPPLGELLGPFPRLDDIAAAHALGHSPAAIARQLGLHRSTIGRRLRMHATSEG